MRDQSRTIRPVKAQSSRGPYIPSQVARATPNLPPRRTLELLNPFPQPLEKHRYLTCKSSDSCPQIFELAGRARNSTQLRMAPIATLPAVPGPNSARAAGSWTERSEGSPARALPSRRFLIESYIIIATMTRRRSKPASWTPLGILGLHRKPRRTR
jgi:hypothetical protein